MSHFPPLIIPRQDHIVSRRSVSPNALRVLYRLKEQGFVAYLVGGCVRDLLLGREPKDFDVVTDATPGQIKRLFRNCRLVGRRFRLAHLHFNDEIIEVATFRSSAAEMPAEMPDREGDGAGRPPQLLKDVEGMVLRDNVFGTPEEDARRRDFTVNALYYSVADFSLIDYVGGGRDLEAGIIRTIGDPFIRFTEDPVRMLRAVRFAALLGFAVEETTWQAMMELAPTIARAAPPRLFEEILKLFLSGEGEKSYQFMRQTGLFAALFPRFNDWLATETNGFPHTRVGQALDLVDAAWQRGEKVSPQLLLCFIFGQYLEERSDELCRGGLSSQQGLDAAVAEFLAESAATVLIPHKLGTMIRDILSSQYRFRKMPGKRASAFVARPGFTAALAYLRFTVEAGGDEGEMLAWWESFAAGESTDLPPVARQQDRGKSVQAGEKKRPRRRRRRGRNKSGVDPVGSPDKGDARD